MSEKTRMRESKHLELVLVLSAHFYFSAPLVKEREHQHM